MNVLYQIEYSQTFANTLDEVVLHLTKYADELVVLDRIDAVIDHFKAHVERTPICIIYAYNRNLWA